MLTGTKWEREQPLREVHTTPPHLWVSAAAVWGMSPDVVLPLLRLAALHLEGELLILERYIHSAMPENLRTPLMQLAAVDFGADRQT